MILNKMKYVSTKWLNLLQLKTGVSLGSLITRQSKGKKKNPILQQILAAASNFLSQHI